MEKKKDSGEQGMTAPDLIKRWCAGGGEIPGGEGAGRAKRLCRDAPEVAAMLAHVLGDIPRNWARWWRAYEQVTDWTPTVPPEPDLATVLQLCDARRDLVAGICGAFSVGDDVVVVTNLPAIVGEVEEVIAW